MTFKKGDAWNGNKHGRPANTGHRQQLFNSLVEPHKDELFKTAINLALNGNESMLRLFLERLLPVKPVDDAVMMAIPEGGTQRAETLLAWGESILQAISIGDITPGQGSALMSVIDAQRKNIETAELAGRVTEIERTLKQRRKYKEKHHASNK